MDSAITGRQHEHQPTDSEENGWRSLRAQADANQGETKCHIEGSANEVMWCCVDGEVWRLEGER